MGIGQSLKKGFSIAGSSMDLVGVLFGFGLVWNLINLAISTRLPQDNNTNPDPATAAMMIVAGLVFVFITIFVQAGSLGYICDKIKSGQAKMASFTKAGGRFYVSTLAVAAVVTLVIGLFIGLAAASAALLTDKLEWLGVVLALVLAAFGLSVIILLFFAPYIVVADAQKAGSAMKQSMALVKKSIGVLLGLSAILILIGFGIGMILGAIYAGLTFLVKEIMVVQVIFAVLSSAVNAYLGTVVSGAFMTLYLSLPKPSAPTHS